MNAPTESQEQRALFEWAARMRGKWPMLAAMYHIPNEGYRSPVTGARMKSEGMRKGVPDICLPIARGKYNALYIELKRTVGGRVSDDQRAWIDLLNAAGNRAVVCRGWEEAAREITRYMEADG